MDVEAPEEMEVSQCQRLATGRGEETDGLSSQSLAEISSLYMPSERVEYSG